VYLGYPLTGKGNFDEAIACYEKAIDLDPNDSLLNNNFAWLLATCPEPKFRNAARAVELGKKAVELSPQQGTFWNTLGVAHFRNGSWKEVIAALNKSMKLRPLGGDSFDWYFLAMADWQLGHKEEARNWYVQAVAWMDKFEPKNEELRRFRAEAEELMKI